VEYWQPSEPWTLPSLPGLWQFKSSTDLFHFKKVRRAQLDQSSTTRSLQCIRIELMASSDKEHPHIPHILAQLLPIRHPRPTQSRRTRLQLSHRQAHADVRRVPPGDFGDATSRYSRTQARRYGFREATGAGKRVGCESVGSGRAVEVCERCLGRERKLCAVSDDVGDQGCVGHTVAGNKYTRSCNR
jgi:hypothetical protein